MSGALTASSAIAVSARPKAPVRPAPARAVPAGPVVCADQVVFTSVRSPTGEGYRIIAASPGLRRDERIEITRRSPSHDALCRTEPDAAGLMGYPLPSGRFCVSCSVYAGTEHTARGGRRVYTRAVLLSPADYRRFGCNPVAVRAGLLLAVGESPDCCLPAVLETLALPLPTDSAPLTLPLRLDSEDEARSRIHLLGHLMTDTRFCLAGGPSNLAVLESMILALPLFVRESLSFSVGLKFSLHRQIRWTLLEGDQQRTQMEIRGHNVQWFDYRMVPAPQAQGQFRAWLDFVERRWRRERHRDLAALTGRMDHRVPAGTLGWVAAICNDRDRVEGAAPEVLADLSAKYTGFLADDPLEAELARDLQQAIVAEQAKHPPPETDADATPNADRQA